MPVSNLTNIAPILQEVERLNPSKVLELGVGFVKYGVLCREVLDAKHGRCVPSEWKHTIYGVEVWSTYANPCWGAYDKVWIKDFTKDYQTYQKWDLVLLVDSLEHVEKTTALKILDYLVEHNKHVIVSVPLGNCPQGPMFGNSYERHLSSWQVTNIPTRYSGKTRVLHVDACGVYLIRGGLDG